MNRREFLRSAGVVSAGLTLPGGAALLGASPDAPWRTFEVTSEIEIAEPSGVTRVWLPTPPAAATVYQKPGETRFTAPGGTARAVTHSKTGATMIAAEWPQGVAPVLSATCRVATRDYAVDLSAPHRIARPSDASLTRFLQPTALLPTGGIVKEKASAITRGATADIDKARAI